MSQSVLELRGIGCEVSPGQPLFEDISFVVNEGGYRKRDYVPALIDVHNNEPLGDIVVLQGKSGSGKTTLLKCIAHLVLHKGKILYRGRYERSHSLHFSTEEENS